jgi:hypothetical protein
MFGGACAYTETITTTKSKSSLPKIISQNYHTNSTSKQQQNICNWLNKCNKVINTNNKWMYINMNPRAPQS